MLAESDPAEQLAALVPPPAVAVATPSPFTPSLPPVDQVAPSSREKFTRLVAALPQLPAPPEKILPPAARCAAASLEIPIRVAVAAPLPVPVPAALPETRSVVQTTSGAGAVGTAVTAPAVEKQNGRSISHAPAYSRNPPPAYPARARQRRWEGTVLLEVSVNAQGRPATVKVKTTSSVAVLDEAAVEAVRQWVFEPARVDQNAVSAIVEVPVRFYLHGAPGK